MQKPTLPTLTELKSWLPRPPVLIAWLLLIVVLAWTYSSAIDKMFFAWWGQAEYGHGFFVMPFALVLLLIRRQIITGEPEPENWWSEWSSKSTMFGASVGAAVGLLLFIVLFTAQRAESTIPKVSIPEQDLAACRIQLGDVMPEAELPDLDGESQPLAEVYGEKATLVFFWKRGESAEDDRKAINSLEALETDYPKPFLEKGVRIIGVNVGNDREAVRRHIANRKVTSKHLFDVDGTFFFDQVATAGLREQVATAGLARVYLLDADGKILWFGQEFSTTTRHNLKQAVRAAVSLTWLDFTTWFYLLLAGAYGALLGGLLLWVVQVFVRGDVVHESLELRQCWWLIPLVLLWILTRWGSAFFVYRLVDAASLVPCLVGFTLFIGGWRALRWAWPSIVFLFFMMPLPGPVSVTLSGPLQWFGTRVTVFVIQTLGIRAVPLGNKIKLTVGELGIVEACSGLRMLMLFFAICIGAAFVMRIALWEKIVIVVSAVPIAVISNVTRLTVTAIVYELARRWPSLIDAQAADEFIHDWAGWMMMPLALLMLWGEMTLLKNLFLEPVSEGPLSLGGSLAGGSANPDSYATSNRDNP